MIAISLKGVTHGYGGPPLLQDAQLTIEDGERVGLLGRNGAGKSTLLGLIEGRIEPDAGRVTARQGLVVASLEQDVPAGLSGSVRAAVEAAVRAHRPGADHEVQRAVETTLSRLDLDGELPLETLSAGAARRALLARALAVEPDLLVLDEPTNHLDIPSILTLEEILLGFRGALLFVTHDRRLLTRVATRILDLDRGLLSSHPADYPSYLARREAEASTETEARARLEKEVAKEEAWLRKGIKARGKRDQGRVRRLEELRARQRAWRSPEGTVSGKLEESARSGARVLRLEDLEVRRDGRTLVREFTADVLRGDRVALVGPNGCGKTTLLDVLFGDRPADGGTVLHGTNLDIARMDQLPDLDPDRTPLENLDTESDTIVVGERKRHVAGWLRDFLFSTPQIEAPVSNLSGGERKRLQIAKILARSANVLVLDEPTNDLDLETLEFLEELLLDFQGTLFLVSHDRDFIDNVVTQTWVFEGEGRLHEVAGGYADWERKRTAKDAGSRQRKSPRKEKPRRDKERPRKLSFKETRELEELPGRIEKLEGEHAALTEKMGDPGFFKQPKEEIGRATTRLEEVEGALESAFSRWEELQAIADG